MNTPKLMEWQSPLCLSRQALTLQTLHRFNSKPDTL